MTMTEPARMSFRQDHPLRASAELRALRPGSPIHRVLTPVGHPAWLVTGYQAVRGLMDGERLGRSHRTPQTAPRSRASVLFSMLFGGPMGDFDAEPAGHARMRALLQPHFSPRHLRALKPRVEALAAGLLDDLERSERPADLHAKVALAPTVLAICELLGVPYSDRGRFRVWLDRAAFATDAEELVLLDTGSANHDPSVFADPDAVDFDRSPNQHVSSGFGYRYCLGAPLAGMELKAVWSQLIPRFPRMTLGAEPGTLRINSNALESALVELPVLW